MYTAQNNLNQFSLKSLKFSFSNKPSQIIGAIYKHPSMNVSTFINDYLKNMFNAVHLENKSTLLTGDFNVNLINYNKEEAHNALELLLNRNFIPQIALPTTVTENSATLIDNIFVNNPSLKCLFGNITTSVSDHLPQFIFLEYFKGSNLKSERIKTTYRNFRYFNIGSFKRGLQEINWNSATENNDIDQGFETFFRLFNKSLDRHAPIKISTRREKKSLGPILQMA